MKSYLSFLFGVLFLLACSHEMPVEKNGESQLPQWPMFRHDVRHTGNVTTDPYEGIVGPRGPNVSVKWSFDSQSDLRGSLAIANDGTIYFGTAHVGVGGAGPDSVFYALTADGTVKWKFGGLGVSGTNSSPAIAADGTIYCVSRIGVFAFNPDGSLKWKLMELGVEGWSAPSLGPDGTLYWSDYRHLNAVTPNGTIKWQLGGGNDFHLPVVDADGITYYNHFDRRTLVAVSPDGTTKWEYTDTGGIIFDSAVIDGEGSIYFLNTNETLYSVSKSGHLKWKIPGIGPIKEINSPAIAPDGTIVVVGYDSLFAISAKGQRLWRTLCDDANAPPVIDAEGNIYLTSATGPIISCYSRSGVLKWQVTDIPTGAVIGGTPLGPDGTLFFGSEDDPLLYALH